MRDVELMQNLATEATGGKMAMVIFDDFCTILPYYIIFLMIFVRRSIFLKDDFPLPYYYIILL